MMDVSKLIDEEINLLISEGIDLYESKKYTEAAQKLNEALNCVSNKTKSINDQIDADSWLSICYLKQSIENKHISNTNELFSQAAEDYKKLSASFKNLTDKEKNTENKINVLSELIQCYLIQAMDSNNTVDADESFAKAIEYCKKWLTLTEKLDENRIDSKINAEYWLGQCYFQQALNNQNLNIAAQLFEKAAKHYENQKDLAKSLDRKTRIDTETNTTYWLGQVNLEHAIKTKDVRKADTLFNSAIKHYKKLSNSTNHQDKIHAEHGLGRCYFEQAIKTKDTESAEGLFELAIQHYQEQLNLVENSDRILYRKEKLKANLWLGRSNLEKNKVKNAITESEKNDIKKYFEQAKFECNKLPAKLFGEKFKENQIIIIKQYEKELEFISKDYKKYFDLKKEYIQEHLQLNQEYLKLNSDLKDAVTSILAVLSISPIEFKKPLAHYTSPFVCERLLGIKQKEEKHSEIKPSKMRMNSSTYMNDPYEGKSLLDFLGIQENSLENKTEFSSHNAFFTCFSTRVNDLNQFRLYGKVSGVEASGCCLIFNKNGNWVNEPDISASYPSSNVKNRSDDQRTILTIRPSEDLPLYQVAYIFYCDEYIKQDEYDVLLKPLEKFGIRLKPISDDAEWHKVREEQLKIALENLFHYFNPKIVSESEKTKGSQQVPSQSNETEEQRQADQSTLEYIRYLFKDYAFRDEEEFRLLQIEELGSEKVKYCHETNSAYVEYADICNKLDEVILGTNYEHAGEEHKVEAFRYLLKQKLPHIKVSHSSLPINAALPARKP